MSLDQGIILHQTKKKYYISPSYLPAEYSHDRKWQEKLSIKGAINYQPLVAEIDPKGRNAYQEITLKPVSLDVQRDQKMNLFKVLNFLHINLYLFNQTTYRYFKWLLSSHTPT